MFNLREGVHEIRKLKLKKIFFLVSSRFRHKNPDDINEVPGGFLSDCNIDSLHEIESLADKSLLGSKVLENFQFERIGFFTVDKDSTNSKVMIGFFFLRM